MARPEWMDWHPDPRDEELEERAFDQERCPLHEVPADTCVACGDATNGGFHEHHDPDRQIT